MPRELRFSALPARCPWSKQQGKEHLPYVAKLNSAGSALLFSTYLGGSSLDDAVSLAVGKSGNIFVTGVTASANFPHTAGAFRTTCPGSCTYSHGFVSKIGRYYSLTSLVSSLNPSTFGQPVTLTATVKPTLTTTTLIPTGTVTFKQGTTMLGTATLVSGSGKFTTSTLIAGSHSIVAVYSGDAIFLGSTSGGPGSGGEQSRYHNNCDGGAESLAVQ